MRRTAAAHKEIHEYLESSSLDDKIILEILTEKFVGSLQDLLNSVEARKVRMPRSIEDYDQIKEILWDVFFTKNCTETQTNVWRAKIVSKTLFKMDNIKL